MVWMLSAAWLRAASPASRRQPPGQPGAAQSFGDKGAAILALQQQQQQQQAQQAEVEARRLAAERQQAAAREQAQLSMPTPSTTTDQSGETVIPNLSSYIHINAGLQLFAQNPQLKRVVPVAIDRAIREIIQPVVERSVTIACVTTRELMLKDFAMEPDEVRMNCRAAHGADPSGLACTRHVQGAATRRVLEQHAHLTPAGGRRGAAYGAGRSGVRVGEPRLMLHVNREGGEGEGRP